MKERILGMAASVALLIGVGVATFAGTASAGTSPTVSPAQHCILNISTKEQKCFSTFGAALSYGTGGTVTGAPDSARDAVRDATLMERLDNPAPGALAVTISINWDASNWEGASFSIFADHECTTSTGNIDWEVGDLATAWNDRINSFVTRNQCDQQMFQHRNFGGENLTGGYWDNMTDMGRATTGPPRSSSVDNANMTDGRPRCSGDGRSCFSGTTARR